MQNNGQQPQKQGRGFKYHFARSTYITAAWDWLMMFAAAACEAILTISVIYSCARLLPALHTPVWLDNTVFIWQMVALDVGGLSLRKMANQARKDGNESGAKFASRVSNALILIMVLNVVLSILQGVAHLDPSFVSVVEGTLLVARAVMAVLYAAVIHSLREDDQAEQTPPPVPAVDVQQIVTQAITELQTRFDQRLGEITAEQQRMLASVQQQLATMPDQAPAVDTQAIAGFVLTSLESRFTSEMKRLQSEMKQQVTISLEREAQQYRSISPQTEMGLPTNAKHNNRQPETQQYSQRKPDNILLFHQEAQETTQETENRKALVIRAYNEDTSRSDDEIVALTGVPKTTVWRYLKPYRDRAKTGEMPIISTTETA